MQHKGFVGAKGIRGLAGRLNGETGRLELEREKRRYRTLVDRMPLVTYIARTDTAGVAYISPQIFDLLGYTAEEWTADPNLFSERLHPDDRGRMLEHFSGIPETRQTSECEYRLIARDGKVVWIHDGVVVDRSSDDCERHAHGYMIDVSERKRTEESLLAREAELQEKIERIEYQALHDSLTDLPNRTLMHEQIRCARRGAAREGSGFAVILLDLDRFKALTDTLGHASGDLVLIELADRLSGATRARDTVGRLGGDEFAILAPGISDPTAARAVAEKIRDELRRPVSVAGIAYEVEASIGIALFPADGADAEALIRHAHVAAAVSKQTHAPTLYAEEFDQDARARLALVSDLRSAIGCGELAVDYQPQTDVSSGEVHKVEALVRWQHPERGLIGPDQFIPTAEQTGLIRALTLHVLDTALGQCSAWRAGGRELTVAVNITTRELVDLQFPDEVGRLLLKWDIDPGRLELEITERTVMNDLPRARAILLRLSELGVRIAIDDFGSGQSSVSCLRGLPLTVLKIDKSFVQRMMDDHQDAAFVRMAIELGHNLGLEVVAEGVETEEEARLLEMLGCDTLQGYHLGCPQTAAEIARPARRRHARPLSLPRPSSLPLAIGRALSGRSPNPDSPLVAHSSPRGGAGPASRSGDPPPAGGVAVRAARTEAAPARASRSQPTLRH